MGWPDITPVTRSLLDHWHAEDRLRSLFFCQIEALETLIYITEVAKQTKYGDVWIEKYLREKAAEAGTELFRVACKMATGSGKTVVMSMLIAWQVLNKRRYTRITGSPTHSSSSPPASRSATGSASCCRPTRTITTGSSTSSRRNIGAISARRGLSSPTSTHSSSARRAMRAA
jgi:hypothetical protein